MKYFVAISFLLLTSCFAKPALAPVAHYESYTNSEFGITIHTRLCNSKTPPPTADCNLGKFGYSDAQVAPK